jgi:ABC-type glucose/galactose transport system permease subunit
MEGGGIVALLALLVPIVMMAILFIPPYVAALISLWMIYGDTILHKWDRFGLVVSTFQKLYRQWETAPSATVTNFFVPVFGPLIVGCLISAWLMWRFMRYVRNVFEA